MKNMKFKSAILMLSAAAILSACNPIKVDNIDDPNNPSLASVEKNATKNQIQFLLTGLESRHKEYAGHVTNAWGSLGREVWFLNRSDSRNSSEWLGLSPTYTLGGNVFGFGVTGGGSYASPYAAIKQANIILDVVANTDKITAAEKSYAIGFAKTIMAYQFLIPANWQYENGIRIDVKDILNPGPYVSYQQALTYINTLLDEGYTELQAAGTTKPFNIPMALSAPADLLKVNRAIAARTAIYRKDWDGALDKLDDSFMNLSGSLSVGPTHVFAGGADSFNPLFALLDISSPANLRAVHPSLIRDAISGDLRVSTKFHTLIPAAQITVTNLLGKYQDARFSASNTAPITFIKNEELILIKAEAHAHKDQITDAVAAINVIRTAAGIGTYTAPTTGTSIEIRKAVLKEILFQRRYSLWAEPAGHRWVDVRRYTGTGADDLFPTMKDDGTAKPAVDRAIDTMEDNGQVYKQFPKPQNEVNWDIYKGN